MVVHLERLRMGQLFQNRGAKAEDAIASLVEKQFS
jgi:hypothetical protein